jgi:hypothetical protein
MNVLAIVNAVLAAASAASVPVMTALRWVAAHEPAIEQAVADVKAGKPVAVIVADLVKLMQ